MRSIRTFTERALPVCRLPGLNLRTATFVIELAVQEFGDWHKPVGRPKVLSLPGALRLTLCRLRRNATYQDLHEDFDIGTTTAWDYHQQMVAFADVLGAGDTASLPALVAGRVCLIDGTLVPTVH